MNTVLIPDGHKGPYRNARARFAYEDRMRRWTTTPPACKCGCGQPTRWDAGICDWTVYATGHYRKAAPYKNAWWLHREYVTTRRTTAEIAAECGVARCVVSRWLKRHGIPARDRSEARIGRKVGDKNSAWRGGVADWDYATGWKAIARKIRDRDEWTCQMCGERRARWGKDLHVHHIDHDKTNNVDENLVSLCAECHREAHRRARLAGAVAA